MESSLAVDSKRDNPSHNYLGSKLWIPFYPSKSFAEILHASYGYGSLKTIPTINRKCSTFKYFIAQNSEYVKNP